MNHIRKIIFVILVLGIGWISYQLKAEVSTVSPILTFDTLLNFDTMGKKLEVKTGEKVGAVTFLYDVEMKPRKGGGTIRRSMFKCSCGKEFISDFGRVKRLNVKSCGCIDRRNSKYKNIRYRKDPLFARWNSIKTRCYNKNFKSYPYYGGSGITMYEPWKESFLKFKEYVVSLPDFDLNLEIDRIDNTKGYYPDNLRWVNREIQMRNTRIRKGNCRYTGVHKRRNKFDWSIRNNGKRYSFFGYETAEKAVQARNEFIKKNNLKGYKIQTI